MGRLDNKVALVSGGARGMGQSHCQVFADEGANGGFTAGYPNPGVTPV